MTPSHDEYAEYHARIAERVKRINALIQQMVTTPRMPVFWANSTEGRQAEGRQAGYLYLHHNTETNSFFLMHRRADGSFECVDRMNVADAEAEGLDLRIG